MKLLLITVCLVLLLIPIPVSADYYDTREEQSYLDCQEETYRMIREREQAQELERPSPYRVLLGDRPVL